MRFGFESGVEMTLEEVGNTFNVTRERIRGIEAKAIRKLKQACRNKKIKATGFSESGWLDEDVLKGL